MASLTAGVLFLCLAAVGFVISLLGARNPRNPAWAGDFLIGNVYAPGIIALLVFGFGALIKWAFTAPLGAVGVGDLWPSAALLVLTVALLKALHPRRALAAYRTQRAEMGEVLPLTPPGSSPEGERPEPPVKPNRPRLAA